MKSSGKIKVFVTGIDTDVGKTVVSAVLMKALESYYWKPIQCGLLPKTDRQSVADLTRSSREFFVEENWGMYTESEGGMGGGGTLVTSIDSTSVEH